MVNPRLRKKAENTLTVNNETKRIFQLIYKEKHAEGPGEEEKIKVSELISKMAFYYEKIRNTVEYKEEHLLMKNAIERILKRQIIIGGTFSIKNLSSDYIAKNLLTELIRAGYLPNNSVPRKKIQEISQVVNKYLLLKKYVLAKTKDHSQEKSELLKWIIAIAASDIEERLGRRQVDLTVIDYMYKILKTNIKLPDETYEKDKDIQIYIGSSRNYLKFDEEMIGFILFKYYNEDWEKADEEQIKKIAEKLTKLKEVIDWQINHPLKGQLNRIINRYTVFFNVLIDVIDEDPVGVYEAFVNEPESFVMKISKVCQKKYAEAQKKLWRAAVRSILYIFITKSLLVFVLEIPAITWFGESVNPISLAINISFPALLLFVIVLFTSKPGDENTKRITEGIKEIAFNEIKREEPFSLYKPIKRGPVLNSVFGIIYAITFFLSFGAVVWLLNKAHFSWVSIIIFLFFLAFVTFFSTRIRKNIKDMLLVEKKENILVFAADFFYVPIVSAGKWLSQKFDKINVFVFVLDFIIEAPFKIFVEITEEWTKYVKERKDEIA